MRNITGDKVEERERRRTLFIAFTMAGWTLEEAAKEAGIKLDVAHEWRVAWEEDRQRLASKNARPIDMDQLLAGLVEKQIGAAGAIMETISDQNWLKQQTAPDVKELYESVFERTANMVASFQATRQRGVGSGPDALPGGIPSLCEAGEPEIPLVSSQPGTGSDFDSSGYGQDNEAHDLHATEAREVGTGKSTVFSVLSVAEPEPVGSDQLLRPGLSEHLEQRIEDEFPL